jgi:site-specific DNA-cytosine methylase
MWKQDVNDNGEYAKRIQKKGNQIMLPAAVKLWPTPTNQSAGKGKFLETLTTKEGEPAKQGERAYNPKTGKHVQITLDRAVKLWPKPTVNDSKNNAGPSQFKRKGTNLNVAVAKAGGNFWDIEPDVGRVVNGLPGRVHRLKGLGNAIVPQIAEEIGRAIMKAEQQ